MVTMVALARISVRRELPAKAIYPSKSMTPGPTPRARTITGGLERRRRFGRYETLFRIAAGGMAEVYTARILGEGGFQKVVALKRMLPTLAEDDRFVTMFLDEGRVAAHISSPNVVQTLDLGRAEDDSLYLVMELVVGVPLGRLVREVVQSKQHVDLDIAVEILAQAASGLHDAHEATTPMGDPLHIVHRDVSPQNILVDRGGRTRITDFGVARAMLRHSQTQTGELKGKMAYFAPEQAIGGTVDRRCDVFALGIVAWEVVSGRRLFRSENPLHTLQKITVDPIPTIDAYRPDAPAALSACIAKALQRDPADRFQTGREFAAALRAAVPAHARSAQVGDYVRLHGGASLDALENGLKLALSGAAVETPEEDRGDERTPVSTSAIVSSMAASVPTAPTEAGRSRAPWIALGVTAVIASLALGVAMSRGTQPHSTPLEPAPVAAPTDVEPAGASGVEQRFGAEPTAAEPLPAEPTAVEPTAGEERDEDAPDEVAGADEPDEPSVTRMRRRLPTAMSTTTPTMTASPMTTMTETTMETAMATETTATEMNADTTQMARVPSFLRGWGDD